MTHTRCLDTSALVICYVSIVLIDCYRDDMIVMILIVSITNK